MKCVDCKYTKECINGLFCIKKNKYVEYIKDTEHEICE